MQFKMLHTISVKENCFAAVRYLSNNSNEVSFLCRCVHPPISQLQVLYQDVLVTVRSVKMGPEQNAVTDKSCCYRDAL